MNSKVLNTIIIAAFILGVSIIAHGWVLRYQIIPLNIVSNFQSEHPRYGKAVQSNAYLLNRSTGEVWYLSKEIIIKKVEEK